MGVKRTSISEIPMSALCHKRTMQCSNLGSLLDHVVRDAEQRWRHGYPEHPSGWMIDNQLKLARLDYWQVRRFSALKDTTGIDPEVSER